MSCLKLIKKKILLLYAKMRILCELISCTGSVFLMQLGVKPDRMTLCNKVE